MCIGGCGDESQTASKHPPLIKNNNKGSDNFEAGIDIDVFLSADERLAGPLESCEAWRDKLHSPFVFKIRQ